MLRLWDAASGETKAEVDIKQVVQSASFSEDGKMIAISRKDSTIAIYAVSQLLGLAAD